MNDFEIPLPSVFVANLIGAGDIGRADNADAASFINEMALRDLGGRSLDQPSAEGDEIIARMMAAEVAWNIRHSDRRASCDWYTASIDDMIRLAGLMFPEIADDHAAARHPSGHFREAREAQTVFFAAIAITSQNNKVNENMRYAVEQYRHFLEVGRFDPGRTLGSKGNAISANLSRFNLLRERAGGDLTRVRRLMGMRLKMSDLRRVAERHGIRVADSELADETVHGSMIFGPKVGNGFYQNLTGNHQPVTIDLWFMRTWGRLTGTLVRGRAVEGTVQRLEHALRRSMRSEKMRALMADAGVLLDPSRLGDMGAAELLSHARKLNLFWEGIRRAYVRGAIKDDMSAKTRKVKRSNLAASELKARLGWPLIAESIAQNIGYPIDQPRSAGQRRWIRRVVARALEILEERGYPMSAADMQATLWYPEKEIYGALTGRNPEAMNTSYGEAMERIVRHAGFTDAEIAACLRSGGAGRLVGRGVPRALRESPGTSPLRLAG